MNDLNEKGISDNKIHLDDMNFVDGPVNKMIFEAWRTRYFFTVLRNPGFGFNPLEAYLSDFSFRWTRNPGTGYAQFLLGVQKGTISLSIKKCI